MNETEKQNAKPLISIVIPIYNVEKFLRQCLESIIHQTYNKWECILVNDGSADNSGDICDEYVKKDQRFQSFHIKNSGVSCARNIALENSKGEFVTFIDSDDYVSPHYLEIIVEKMRDVDLLMFSNQIFYGNGKTTTRQRNDECFYTKENVEKYILELKSACQQQWEFWGYIWNKCYRRKIIEQYNIRFTEKLSYREDNVFNEAYYRKIHSMKILSDVLYFYRYTTSGLTHKNVSRNEYLSIARGLEKETNEIEYVPLLLYDKERVLDFFLRANSINFIESFRLFQEIKRVSKNYNDKNWHFRKKWSFKGAFIKNLFWYIVFYYIPFILKKIYHMIKTK